MRNIALIVGFALTMLPQAMTFYIGNWITYAYSYFKEHLKEENCEQKTFWIFPVYQIGFVTGLLSVDVLRKFTSPTKLLSMTLIIEPLVLFGSYWTVQHSLLALMMTFGVMNGLLSGWKWACELIIAKDKFAGNIGKATSSICCMSTIGGIIISAITTNYVNPDNLAPNARYGNILYFGYKSIHDRVPDVFLVIGSIFALCNFLGLVLMQPIFNPLPKDQNSCMPSVSMNMISDTTPVENYRSTSTESASIREVSHIGNTDANECIANVEQHPIVKSHASSHTKQDGEIWGKISSSKSSDRTTLIPNGAESCTTQNDAISNNRLETDDGSNNIDEYKTLINVLKSSTFIILWFTALAGSSGLIVVNTGYKLFGQLWITDDHFLAATGYTMSIIGGFTRLTFGISVDQFGAFNTIMVNTINNALGLILWYFSARINKWVFFVWTAFVMGTNGSSMFSVHPVALLKCFGASRYATNTGLLMTALVAASLLIPSTTLYFERELGWFWVFQFAGLINTLSLIPLLIIMYVKKLHHI